MEAELNDLEGTVTTYSTSLVLGCQPSPHEDGLDFLFVVNLFFLVNECVFIQFLRRQCPLETRFFQDRVLNPFPFFELLIIIYNWHALFNSIVECWNLRLQLQLLLNSLFKLLYRCIVWILFLILGSGQILGTEVLIVVAGYKIVLGIFTVTFNIKN